MRLVSLAVFVSLFAVTASVQARLQEGDVVHFYQRGDDNVGTIVYVDGNSKVKIHYFASLSHGIYPAHVTLENHQVSPAVTCFGDICSRAYVHFASPWGDKKVVVRHVFANGRVCLDYLNEGPKKESWASVGQVSHEIVGAGGFTKADCVTFGANTGVVTAVFRNGMAEVLIASAPAAKIVVDTSRLAACLKSP